jgi:hypothetical protein
MDIMKGVTRGYSHQIDTASLSDHQKSILQKILEVEQSMTYDMLAYVVNKSKKGMRLSDLFSHE